jgi:ABC-2 type transport system ATP-binding protein
MGKTIIVSSHILPELADICNKVGIINRGEMGFNAHIDELIKTVRPQTVLIVEVADAARSSEAVQFLSAQALVDTVVDEHGVIEVTMVEGEHDYSLLAGQLVSAGFGIKRFAEKETNLESAFMALTKGSGVKI